VMGIGYMIYGFIAHRFASEMPVAMKQVQAA